ncbi:MAG: SUMF1/EgtB/PvdO family nonheme iron enzyme [Hyphomicrobiaceae bacterium]|nr:SUMF1/EgtB/PvdO family nonheme iron enzyme [Hyphomicrobiaceae bacterium]
MRTFSIFALVLTCLVAGLGSVWQPTPAASAERRRLGFIVGINDYRETAVRDLARAANDARDLSERLAAHGFDVTCADQPAGGERHALCLPKALLDEDRAARAEDGRGADLDIDRVESLWLRFVASLQPGDFALFAFAGHGLEYSGVNYLLTDNFRPLPVNASAQAIERSLFGSSLSLDTMMALLRKRLDKLREDGETPPDVVFVIDACRETLDPAQDRTRFMGVPRTGLTAIVPPGGVFVFFSAGTGQRALDSRGDSDPDRRNSVYMRHLRKLFERSDRDLADIAKDVRFRVYKDALPDTQTPAYYDGLLHRLSITGRQLDGPDADVPPIVVSAAPTPAMPRSARPVEGADLERELAAKADELQTTRLDLPLTTSGGAPPAAGEVITKASDTGNVIVPASVTTTSNPSLIDCVTCPELVVVAPGAFVMGRAPGPGDDDLHEGPPQGVTLTAAFAIAKHEVTVGEWAACVAGGGCTAVDPGYAGITGSTDRYPMRNVTWQHVQGYLTWLSQESGHTYRLPSEGEWEFAARAGTTSAYSFGDDAVALCKYANGADQALETWLYAAEHCRDEFGAIPAPVGSFKANALGLHDMHGNVWEWVADCWSETHAGSDPAGSARSGTGSECERRTVRGGSYRSVPAALRSTSRNGFAPDHARRTIGFRVARSIAAP